MYFSDESLTQAYTSDDAASNKTVYAKFEALGYRLPTEVEWEYAARGGNVFAKEWNYSYAGAQSLDAIAWYSENSDRTHEVGSLRSNSLGIYDMNGNVTEWTWNRYGNNDYEEYASSYPEAYPKSSNDGLHVIRGGSYRSADDALVLTSRNGRNSLGTAIAASAVGFRIARTLEF